MRQDSNNHKHMWTLAKWIEGGEYWNDEMDSEELLGRALYVCLCGSTKFILHKYENIDD